MLSDGVSATAWILFNVVDDFTMYRVNEGNGFKFWGMNFFLSHVLLLVTGKDFCRFSDVFENLRDLFPDSALAMKALGNEFTLVTACIDFIAGSTRFGPIGIINRSEMMLVIAKASTEQVKLSSTSLADEMIRH